MPSVDSTILINNAIASPDRVATDVGIVDLRATNVLVNALIEADEGFRVLESRFHNSANAVVAVEADVVAQTKLHYAVGPGHPRQSNCIGSQVFAGEIFGDRVDEVIPPDTNVIIEPDPASRSDNTDVIE